MDISNSKAELSAAEKRALLVQLLHQKASQPSQSFPLSANQQALWFLYQLAPESWAYNVLFSARICSQVDIPALQRAFQYLVDRHPALRTTYATENGSPVQRVQPSAQVHFVETDASEWSSEQLHDRLTLEGRRPFDLENGPIFRVHLFSRSATDCVLLLAVHHVAVDLWSIAVLLDELRVVYAAQVAGSAPNLPELNVQYVDYVGKQAKLLQSEAGDRLFSYWQQQLEGDLPILNMPSDRPRPPAQTFSGASQPFQLAPELTGQLKSLARAKDSTLYVLLLAAFQVLLCRHTHQTDILVGSPTAGRHQREFSGVVGDFINAVALRADLSEDPSFTDFLIQVRSTVADAIQYQAYPFSRLAEQLPLVQGDSHSPVFQSFFVLQKLQRFEDLSRFILPTASDTRIDFGGLELEPYPLPHQEGQFDLTLEMIEIGDILQGNLKYNTDLFDASTIAKIIDRFQTLLAGIVENPQRSVSSLPLLPAQERHQLLVEWNATATDYPRDARIHELFEARVRNTPDAIAVVCQDRQLTYAALDRQANQLAHYLQSVGVKPTARVGICLERSLELIVGLLAILKAGGTYIPMDLSYPSERLATMAEDADITVLLSATQSVSKLGFYAGRIVCLDDLELSSSRAIADRSPHSSTTALDLAYISFTSGSTGRPKGVCVTHRGVVRLVMNSTYVSICDRDIFLQLAPISFDAATFEIWGALLNGAKLVLYPDMMPTPDSLASILHRESISILWLTAGLFHLMVDRAIEGLLPVKQLLAGGDVLSPRHIQTALAALPDCTLINGYGPTENTTFTCCYTIPSDLDGTRSIPIGRPIDNTQVYVLDAAMQPVPTGVSGQLFIGGEGLARGYFNRPDLTAQRWIDNPFNPNEKLYSTGDIVRYLPDGNLDFLGRSDGQVKIRGFRIELGEIEAALAQMPELESSLTVVREDMPGDKRIVAYAAPKREAGVAIADLRNHLKDKLPGYMMPSAYVVLDRFPLTANGKIDRKALPAPQVQSTAEVAQPRDVLERELVQIWESCLDVRPIGIQDNFFELGGHSLLAVKILAEMEAKANLKLSINQLFQLPTIEAIAETLDERKAKFKKACLVPLKSGDESAPLFLIHAIGSSILFYQPLVEHLQTKRPIYGIQSAFLRDPDVPIHSIEALAEYYIQHIQQIQPHGPYCIGGASFGGLVAYEMAQQLVQKGEAMSALLLFDRPAPGVDIVPSAGKRYQKHWQKLIESGPSYLAAKIKDRSAFELERMRATLRKNQRQIYKKLDLSTEKFLGETIVSRQTKLAHKYVPDSYPGDIHIIRAEDASDDGLVFEGDLGWSQYVQGQTSIWPNSGSHMTIFKPPHVSSLARSVDTILAGDRPSSISETQSSYLVEAKLQS